MIRKEKIFDDRVGQILLQCGLIGRQELDEALRIANAAQLPVGSVLVMCGYMIEAVLRAVVKGQALLRDGQISMPQLARILITVNQRNCSIEDALFSARCQQPDETQQEKVCHQRLGDLLIESKTASIQQIARAIVLSESTGLPLGRLLVLSGIISQSGLNLCLEVQDAIRSGTLTRDAAIARLRSDLLKPDNASRFNTGRSASDAQIRVGELLVRAGLISQSLLLNALELALSLDRPIGEVLTSIHGLPELYLRAALKLQQLIRIGHLDVQRGIDALSQFKGLCNAPC